MREIVRARHVLLEFNGRDVLNISELSVAENERIGLIGASRSGAPRPLQKPHRGFCDTGLRVPDRKTKTAPWGRFFVLVRVAIQNFLKNPVISTVLGFRTTFFLA